jgi:hypothetical protein
MWYASGWTTEVSSDLFEIINIEFLQVASNRNESFSQSHLVVGFKESSRLSSSKNHVVVCLLFGWLVSGTKTLRDIREIVTNSWEKLKDSREICEVLRNKRILSLKSAQIGRLKA